MPSDLQLEANRRNAQKSTGPRTPYGKLISSQNARRHGLSGRLTHLTEEDQLLYAARSRQLIEELQPVGQLEEGYVQTIHDCQWQINRYRAFEENILLDMTSEAALETEGGLPVDVAEARAVRADYAGPMVLHKLARHETDLQRKLSRAVTELRKLQKDRMTKNRVEVIHVFEETTRTVFDPKRDRIQTPTGFVLEESIPYGMYEDLCTEIEERRSPAPPSTPETGPDGENSPA